MSRSRLKGEAYITIAAIIWGTAFIFQKMGMDYLGPFAFSFYKFTLGGILLLPLILIIDGRKRRLDGPESVVSFRDRYLLKGGFFIGVSNFVAGVAQQTGVMYTTAGKAGFVSTLYIVIIPLLMIFLRKKLSWLTWLGVAVATFGLYLLCITEGFTLNPGDGILIFCAFGYAVQILLIDHYTRDCDVIKLSFLQYIISGLMCGICALIFEGFSWNATAASIEPILYCSVLEVAVAFTLQIVGQKYTPATIAAIIMSLEGVFAVVADAVFNRVIMTGQESIGCLLMLIAFILVQLPAAQPKDITIDSANDRKGKNNG